MDDPPTTGRNVLVTALVLVLVFFTSWGLAEAVGMDELGGGVVPALVIDTSGTGPDQVATLLTGREVHEDVVVGEITDGKMVTSGDIIEAFSYRGELSDGSDTGVLFFFSGVCTVLAGLCAAGVWSYQVRPS